jgi:hypothetical protein
MADRAEESLTWNEKALRLILRLGAVTLLLAVGAIFLPFSWMAAVHSWLGLGELEDTPLTGYLMRSLSALYAFHGAIVLVISLDVRRYGPLIRLLAVGSIVIGAFLLVLDIIVGMPLVWIVGEGPSVMVLGVVLFWLQGRLPNAPA